MSPSILNPIDRTTFSLDKIDKQFVDTIFCRLDTIVNQSNLTPPAASRLISPYAHLLLQITKDRSIASPVRNYIFAELGSRILTSVPGFGPYDGWRDNGFSIAIDTALNFHFIRDHITAHIDFEFALLDHAILNDACISETSFYFARLEKARLVNVDAHRTYFENAQLAGAILSGDFSECRFVGADAPGAFFTGNFTHSNWMGPNLRDASFIDCDLTEASFNPTEQRGISFTSSPH